MSKAEVITTSVLAGIQTLSPFLLALLNRNNNNDNDNNSNRSTRQLKRQIRSLKKELKELDEENSNLQETLEYIVQEFPEVQEFLKGELEYND